MLLKKLKEENTANDKQRLRRQTAKYISNRYSQKNKKFAKKVESKEFTYKPKEKQPKKEKQIKENKKKSTKNNLEDRNCPSCGKFFDKK